jgi:hypothetical protein
MYILAAFPIGTCSISLHTLLKITLEALVRVD